MCTQSSLPMFLSVLVLEALVASLVHAERPDGSLELDVPVVSMVSASYGGRGHKEVMPQCPQRVLCVMYTDKQVKQANGWIVDTTPYHTNMKTTQPNLFTSGRHSYGQILQSMVKNTMAARFYKMNHFRLPWAKDVDIIFWCDADAISSACQTPHLANSIRNLLGSHAMTVKRHPERVSVHAEMKPAADRCKSRGYSDAMQDIKDAVAHLEKLGFKDDAGLFDSSQFISDARSQAVQSMFHTWWHEVQDYTFRDQISFPFLLQHFNLSMLALPPKELPLPFFIL